MLYWEFDWLVTYISTIWYKCKGVYVKVKFESESLFYIYNSFLEIFYHIKLTIKYITDTYDIQHSFLEIFIGQI